MTARRFLLLVGVLLLIGVALRLAPSGDRNCITESLVIATPYTNALLGRSFEARVVRTIPGVLRVEAFPNTVGNPGSGIPLSTNGVAIRIIAVGPTPQGAEYAANVAINTLFRTVFTNYGVTGATIIQAKTARSYSYFHDSFEPAMNRLFSH